MTEFSHGEPEKNLDVSQTDITGGGEEGGVMGDAFRRAGSRVWWCEEATEAVEAALGAGGGGASPGVGGGQPPAAERSSSSPSSSHRSADSGFSDRSASPGGGCVGNPFIGRLELSCFERSPDNRKKKQAPAQQKACAKEGVEDEAVEEAEAEGEEVRPSSPSSPLPLSCPSSPESPLSPPPSPASPPPASPPGDELDFTGADGPTGPPPHTSTPKAGTPRPAPRARRPAARPAGLLAAFNSVGRPCGVVGGVAGGVAGAGAEAGAPVRRWLSELAAACEPECTTALQSKSLAADLGRQVAAAAAAHTSSVHALHERSRRIAAEFNKLSRQLELGTLEHVGPLVQSLTGHVAEFSRQQQPEGGGGKCGGGKGGGAAEALEHACNALREAAVAAGAAGPDPQRLRADAMALGAAFTAVVDEALLAHITTLCGVLEAPASEVALRAALAALAALGLEGRRLGALAAQAGAVRSLLQVVLESPRSSVRAAALRALAAIACAPDAIRAIEQAGGVEVLAELLADGARPEPELAEAAAVLAQATAPWVDDNPGVRGLADHLAPIILALTGLAERTQSAETLLLSACALANVAYMEPRAVWPLLGACAAGRLLQAVRRQGSAASVFLQEQAAALLAAMAAVPEARAPLATQRAVVALLCFLQVRASPLQQRPEIAAAERLQHKSAIALSRLCSDPAVAEQVVELQGVPRLIRLCRDERERNHSDGVLVACLAALRKIASNCGNQIIEENNALELVEPRLLDSFLLYSSRQESYV